MAQSRNNVITFGLSGLIGNMLVFRQRANKTVVADRPKPSSKAPSASQLEYRDRFTKAVQYASSVMPDPVLKAAYQAVAKPGQNAFNTAFADYQRAPELDEEIDLDVYTGEALGEEISISVIDDFRVAAVWVQIIKPDASVLEEGDAIQSANGLDWIYTTTTANPERTGSKVVFTASDLPGNRTVLEIVIDA